MGVRQRASDMETLYRESADPWENEKTGRYFRLLNELVGRVDRFYRKGDRIVWCDIGCGGGNVIRSITKLMRDRDRHIHMRGVDISTAACGQLWDAIPRDELLQSLFWVHQMDLEEFLFSSEDFIGETPSGATFGRLGSYPWMTADVVSMIEFLYYLGDKRPWKDSFNEVWKGMKPGALMVIADSLIPYQYRDYPKKLSDAVEIDSWTEMSEAVSIEKEPDGRTWNRWLKVRIYQKVTC